MYTKIIARIVDAAQCHSLNCYCQGMFVTIVSNVNSLARVHNLSLCLSLGLFFWGAF